MKHEKLKSLEKGITDLCILIHSELCNGEDQEESVLNLSEVMTLDSLEALEHVTDAVQELLALRRDAANSSGFDTYKSNDGYEKALQKLEQEVRNHIKLEQQMKIHIENTQHLLDESEKIRRMEYDQASAKIEELEHETKSLQTKFDESENLNVKLKRELKYYHDKMNERQPLGALSARNETDESRSRNWVLSQTVKKIKQKEKQKEGSNSHLQNILKKYSIGQRKRSVSPMISNNKRSGDKDKFLATTRSAIKTNVLKTTIARSNSVERVRKDKLSVSQRPTSSLLKRSKDKAIM